MLITKMNVVGSWNSVVLNVITCLMVFLGNSEVVNAIMRMIPLKKCWEKLFLFNMEKSGFD